jgi:hypothetical protein
MNMKGNGSLTQEASPGHTGQSHITPACCLLVLIRYDDDSTLTTEVIPSFILLAIQGSKVVTYVYELHGDQVDVSKSEFSKA